jgi:hypothetical protein
MRWGDAWRRTRLYTAMAVMRMLLGRAVAEAPSRYVTDLTEILYLPDVRKHVTECTPWTSALVEEYGFPSDFPLHFRRSQAFERRYIHRMSDVIAAPRSGVVLIPGRESLVAESYGGPLRAIGWGDVRPDLLARPVDPEWPGPVMLCPPTGYYHWLLEILPRVLAAHDSQPTAKAVVTKNGPSYIYDALSLLGIDRVETDRRAVRLHDVLVPGALQASGFVPSGDVKRLRDSVLPRVSDLHLERSAPELVYISRAKDARRKLGNETAVEALVTDLGFDVVYLQDLTWTEQVHRMSGAHVVVSPHGAGLANMIWANALSSVIEIFAVGAQNDCYARLALQRGANYSFLEAEPERGSNGTVDLETLKQLIASSLISADVVVSP